LCLEAASCERCLCLVDLYSRFLVSFLYWLIHYGVYIHFLWWYFFRGVRNLGFHNVSLEWQSNNDPGNYTTNRGWVTYGLNVFASKLAIRIQKKTVNLTYFINYRCIIFINIIWNIILTRIWLINHYWFLIWCSSPPNVECIYFN
jgi:hypothetical protein